MKKEKEWVILDLRTKKLLYGVGRKTLTFSTEDIAIEVAEQFFEVPEIYTILNIKDINL